MKPNRFAQITVFSAGLIYLLVTLIMFAAPYWFYENVGHFPPFNRHYMGDTASFLLPLAIGLMVAAKDPTRHRLVIAIGAAASAIHTLNHFYDPIIEGSFNHAYDHILKLTTSEVYWLLEFAPLILMVVTLVAAYREIRDLSCLS